MADILVISIREEDKDEFTVELIKNLMSRGLTVSYTGVFYPERKGEYIYDSVTNLLFFASAYFREASMKSKRDFKDLRGFVDNIDFKEVDARFVIFAITCFPRIDQKNSTSALGSDVRYTGDEIYGQFLDNYFLEHKWTELIVEMIRSSFEVEFPSFELRYPNVSRILNLDDRIFAQSRERVIRSEVGAKIEWSNKIAADSFERFIGACVQIPQKKEIEELRKLQREVQCECHSHPSNGSQLILDFFGTEIIDKAFKLAELIERDKILSYLDISGKISKKKQLILLYEEKGSGKGANLCIYSGNGTIEGMKGTVIEDIEIPRIPIKQIGLEEPKELYSSRRIREVIDDYVMLELHPPLVDIHFPDDGPMLEIDPEEPEIGFLSTSICRNNCETIEECLRVDVKLRDRLRIYRWDRDDKKFHELKSGERRDKIEKKNENLKKEDILVIGRIRYLFRVLITSKKYRITYEWFRAISSLSLPMIIIFFAMDILLTYFSNSQEAISTILKTVVGVFLVMFTFWASRDFILKYILEPVYDMLKLFSYSIILIILSLEKEFPGKSSILLLIIPVVIGICLCRDYISSAILYELNNSYRMIECDDILKIESFDNQDTPKGKIYRYFPINFYVRKDERKKVKREVRVLRCGRFYTIIEENNKLEAHLNSYIFPKIEYIVKSFAHSPQEVAYSSGILPSSTGNDEFVQELLYRKPRTWGFWGTLGSVFFGKGEIESRNSSDGISPSNRFVYFGQWDRVMNHIRSAIPVFPQLVLFRNMIILIILSGLLFNIFREDIFRTSLYKGLLDLFNIFLKDGISIESFTEWLGDIGFLNAIWLTMCLISPFICIFLIIKLKFRIWKVFLALIFFYLIGLYLIQTVILAVSVFLMFCMLFWFPLEQVLWFVGIWGNEKTRGYLISVTRADNGQKGTGIQKDFLTTRILMYDPDDPHCAEEERIYFNKRFFENIILSRDWQK
jgi:hypothetical protein